jgi:hypothetical protein
MAFTNTNVCKNYSLALAGSTGAGGAYKELADQECSEIVIAGPAGGCFISDGGGTRHPSATTTFRVPADQLVTIRGLTNSNQLSACQATGSVQDIYYRTQFYSSMVVSVG